MENNFLLYTGGFDIGASSDDYYGVPGINPRPLFLRDNVRLGGNENPSYHSVISDTFNVDDVEISNNIFAHLQPNFSAWAFHFRHAYSNVEVSGNVIYDWAAGYQFGDGQSDDITDASGPVNFHDNIVQMGSGGIILSIVPGANLSNFNMANNKYWTTNPENNWFSVSGGSQHSFEQYQSIMGDTTSVVEQVSFTDPNRKVKEYLEYLNQQFPNKYNFNLQDETEATEIYIGRLGQQSRTNWDTNFMACKFNNYIREGFDKASVQCMWNSD